MPMINEKAKIITILVPILTAYFLLVSILCPIIILLDLWIMKWLRLNAKQHKNNEEVEVLTKKNIEE